MLCSPATAATRTLWPPSLSVSFPGTSAYLTFSCQLQAALSQPLVPHASSNSFYGRPFSWNTAAKLSSEHWALTHRHSSPHCSLTGVPDSSDHCAGSRVFLAFQVLALTPEDPVWVGPPAGHSQQLCSRSVWGRGGMGIPRPKLPPGAIVCCPQGTQFLFLLQPFPPVSLTMSGVTATQQLRGFSQDADSNVQGFSFSLPLCLLTS